MATLTRFKLCGSRAEQFESCVRCRYAARWATECATPPLKITAGKRCGIVQDLVVGSRRNQSPPFSPAPGPEIKMVIGRARIDIGIVLHHQNGVSQVAKIVQDLDQPLQYRDCAIQ